MSRRAIGLIDWPTVEHPKRPAGLDLLLMPHTLAPRPRATNPSLPPWATWPPCLEYTPPCHPELSMTPWPHHLRHTLLAWNLQWSEPPRHLQRFSWATLTGGDTLLQGLGVGAPWNWTHDETTWGNPRARPTTYLTPFHQTESQRPNANPELANKDHPNEADY